MTILIDVGDGTLIAPPPAVLAPAPAPTPPPPPTTTTASNPIPTAGVPLIDVGDGTTIVAPPAALPPPQVAAPPPPPPTGGSTQGNPIPQPGVPLIDLGDVLGPSLLIPAPPASGPETGGGGTPGGGGGGVGGTDDLGDSQTIALANRPDLSNLPAWQLLDPFDARQLASANPVLKGGGALSAIAQACSDYGVDALAAVADALHEGAGGGIGDGGLAYGPFQDHLTEFADRPFYGKGRNNPTVNAWAWTANGIRYSVRAMVNGSPSAKGLRGHPAVYAIVYGYERPQDKAGAYKTRAAEYDNLVKRGSGWAAYAAPLFAGPQAGGGVDTTPIGGGSSTPYKPAGVTANWRDLVDVFKVKVPAEHGKVKALGSSLKEVFR